MPLEAYIGMKVTPEVKAALQEAAGTPGARGSNGRTTTWAKKILIEKLIEKGFLPPEEEDHVKAKKTA